MELLATSVIICTVLGISSAMWFILRAYVRLARRCDIVDGEGQSAVVTGGGIIIPIAYLIAEVYRLIATVSFVYPWLFAGIAVIATISFIDDINHLPPLLRLAVHFACALLMLWQVESCVPSLQLSFWQSLLIVIGIVAVTNSFNFMDGIKGITGCYALAVFVPPLFFSCPGLNDIVLMAVTGAVVAFCTFNFRTPERCYCGDTGAITLGYFASFYLLLYGSAQHNVDAVFPSDFTSLTLIIVYMVDFALTLFLRAIRRENLLKAHRSHLFQRLAFEKHIPHMHIALGYATTQVAITAAYLLAPVDCHTVIFIVSAAALSLSYSIICYRLRISSQPQGSEP